MLHPLKPPKIQQKVVELLSDAEIERLLAVFDRNDSTAAARHRLHDARLACEALIRRAARAQEQAQVVAQDGWASAAWLGWQHHRGQRCGQATVLMPNAQTAIEQLVHPDAGGVSSDEEVGHVPT